MSTRSTRRAKRLAQNQAANPQSPGAPNADAPNATAPNATAPSAAASKTATPNDASANDASAKTEARDNALGKVRKTKRGEVAVRSSQNREAASKTQRGFKPGPSRQRVAPRSAAAAEAKAVEAKAVEVAPEEQSLLWWKIAGFCVLLLAAALRLWNLDLVPFHHDEGVNGVFVKTLFRAGEYKYDPTNFHGPTLYYFALVSAYFNTFLFGKAGLNDFSLRVVPALFGVGTVFLTLGLRRHLGAWASLLAASLLAVSPGMVYISRYFIHEMQFVFFTLLAVVAMLRLRPRGAWWWPSLLSLFVAGLFSVPQVHGWLRDRGVESLSITQWQFLIVSLGLFFALTKTRPTGNTIWMVVASVSMAMVFGSKETAPISVVALLLAGALTWLLCDFLPSPLSSTRFGQNNEPNGAESSTASNVESSAKNGIGSSAENGIRRGGWRIVAMAAGAICAFWLVTAIFFSSFGYNYSMWSFGRGEPAATSDFFAAYDLWRKTGDSDFHAKPFLAYVVWMLTIESPILVLGVLGTMLALWQRRDRFVLFCGLWACGLMLIYSKVSYKTPWLMLNFALPLAIVSGWMLQQFGAWLGARISSTRSLEQRAKTLVWTTLLPALPIFILCFMQMRFLNFIEYDNDEALENAQGQPRKMLGIDVKKYPYVYAHTRREYSDLLHEIDGYAARSGLGKQMPITVASPEHWPMPWSLRDYPVGYYGQVTALNNEAVIIGRIDQDAQLQSTIGSLYVRVGQYALRPAVILTLWVRRDLATG